jgi:hypothetical protein
MKALMKFLLLGGLLYAPLLNAQILPVSARLTLQQQNFSTLKKGVYTDRIKTTRLNVNSLIALLAGVYTNTFPEGFPAGSRLMLVNYSYFQIQAPDGSIVVTNVSDFMTYSDTYRNGDYLFQGKENTITESQNHRFLYQATITFTDPSPNGTSFTFTGNVQERYSKSAANRNGERTYRDSMAFNGSGSGKTGDSFFLLSGRFSTSTDRWIE